MGKPKYRAEKTAQEISMFYPCTFRKVAIDNLKFLSSEDFECFLEQVKRERKQVKLDLDFFDEL